MRILKTYTGITSNTLGGRDDRYPETKLAMFKSIGSLASTYGTEENEKYFQLVEIPREKMDDLIKVSLEAKEERVKKIKRDSIEKEIIKLQRELKELD